MAGTKRRSVVRPVLTVVLGLVAVVLVSLAAEVSMTPPPFAPRHSPAPANAGEWRGTARIRMPNQSELSLPLHLTIQSDGTVRGLIGQARVEARFEWNRSWLGRAFHLRSDYTIVGEVTGFAQGPAAGQQEKLSVPLQSEGTYMRGVIFIGKRGPSQVSLFLVRRQESTDYKRHLGSL